MHEFSLACSIIEIVTDSAVKVSAQQIPLIILEIGTLAGVENKALLTALESLTSNTFLEKTKIQIEQVRAEAKCLNCSSCFKPKDLFELCPKCNNYNFEILKGKEFRVKSIEVITP